MSKHKLKILSIDGGGIKGIIPCTILAYIEKKTNTRIGRLFHVLAGTSTGGIIALGLTKANEDGGFAYSAADMLDLYLSNGKNIFSKRPKDMVSWLGSIVQKGLTDKNFDVQKFEQILLSKFEDARLKDSLSEVLVTTYSPGEEKPFYFSSRLAKIDEKENILIREIARSTSAAPTYFKPSKVNAGNKTQAFVDGGVFANNPSILAYSEAKEIWKKQNKTMRVHVPENIQHNAKTFEAVVEPDDNDLPFFLLSLGCGHSPATINYNDMDDWRTKDWIKPLLTDIFMQSVAASTDYTMKYLLPPFEDAVPRYMRLDLPIPEENSQMEDSSDSNLKALQKIATSFVSDNKKQLDEVCDLLTR
jgi:predicted acylesterase/phospholipase RssA